MARKRPPRLTAEERKALRDQLRIVRRYTGDKFSDDRGYDAGSAKREGMSRARIRTVERYFNRIQELSDRPHRVYGGGRDKPTKSGSAWRPHEKREAFAFTGQKGFPRFQVAIIPIPVPTDPYAFDLDMTRPEGSRFVMVNQRTGERSWHIPVEVFVWENPQLWDEDEALEAEFFEDVLDRYAEKGPRHTYVIEAGEYHMWGSSGKIPKVAEELAKLFKNYGAGNFDAYDRNSHFIGNWFRGVQVYSNPDEFAAYAMRQAEKRAKFYRERRPGMDPFTRYRGLNDGSLGVFNRGELIQRVRPAGRYQCPTCKKRFDRLAMLARHQKDTGHT